MKIITIVALISLLSCCGPTYKLRRVERLIHKAELAGAKWSNDTVFKEIEVLVPQTRVDSIIVIEPGDSTVIFKDRLQVRIKRLRGDTVFVAAKCKADTVKIEVPVTVTKEIVVHGRLRWYHLVGWSLLALLIGVIVGRLFKLVI